jgi:hypothetical protein
MQKKSNSNFCLQICTLFRLFFFIPSKRTEDIVKWRLPRVALIRCNFNTKCMKTIYRNELSTCIEKMLDNKTDHSSSGFKKLRMPWSFTHWLKNFHTVLLYCDILFKQLQKRTLYVVAVKKFQFEGDIQKITLSINNII